MIGCIKVTYLKQSDLNIKITLFQKSFLAILHMNGEEEGCPFLKFNNNIKESS